MKPDFIKKICVIYKRSVYQKYIVRKRNPHLVRLYKTKHPLTNRFRSAHASHTEALRKILDLIKATGIPFKAESRQNIGRLDSYDLIITVGGDGTFLRTSHYVENQIMWGINSAPEASVGALLSTTLDDFPDKLKRVAKGQFRIVQLNRLRVSVNGKVVDSPALNDILFTHRSPAGIARYTLKIGNQKEEQRSSGIWISTAAGSTAAIRAAGGKKMPLTSRKIQYWVREPYSGFRADYKLGKGQLSPPQKIEIQNLTLHADLFIDGLHTIHPLRFGDQITIQNSPQQLKVISFSI